MIGQGQTNICIAPISYTMQDVCYLPCLQLIVIYKFAFYCWQQKCRLCISCLDSDSKYYTCNVSFISTADSMQTVLLPSKHLCGVAIYYWYQIFGWNFYLLLIANVVWIWYLLLIANICVDLLSTADSKYLCWFAIYCW